MKKKRTSQLPLPPRPSRSRGIHLAIFFLLVLAGIFLLFADHPTGDVVYRNYGQSPGGGGFGGFFSFQDLYYQYGYLFDTAIFLLIFLGLGKSIFTKRFGESGTSIYTGIGLFLAFALLLWEERTGIYLLESGGPFALIIFVVLILVGIFLALKSAGASTLWSVLLILLAFVFFLFFLKINSYGFYLDTINFFYMYIPPLGSLLEGLVDFFYNMREDGVPGWMYIPLGLLVVPLLFLIKKIFTRRRTDP